MNKLNKVFIFASSVLLVFSVFVVSGGVQPHPVEGGDDSLLLLSPSNPAVISEGVPGSGTISYKNSITMHYDDVLDTPGYHTTIKSGGKIYNDSSTIITTLTSITATFSGTGSLMVGGGYHRETVVANVALTTEVASSLDHYDYFEVLASGGDVLLTSLAISYTCSLEEPVMNYTNHTTYYDFAYVTRDPYVVEVP